MADVSDSPNVLKTAVTCSFQVSIMGFGYGVKCIVVCALYSSIA